MTMPANPTIESTPYGAQPVVVVVGAQGGPYDFADATHGLPVQVVASAGAASVGVQGNVASGVADSGNPVKTGGRASSGAPTAVTTLQRVDAWYGLNGGQVVFPGSADAGADAVASRTARDPAGTVAVPSVQPYTFNGTNSDRVRGNVDTTLLASAARTATVQSADQVNCNGKRLLLIVDVSLVGTGSITPSLQVKDPISGNYFTFWTAAAAIVTGATFAYLFEGGASGGSFTEKLAFGLPSRTWRLVMTHNNANTITYSASANVGV